MSYRKKFRIKGLKKRQSFRNSLGPVLGMRLRAVEISTENFLAAQDVERLHTLRIAFRRFRYALEIYCSCIKPRRFKSIYGEVMDIQEITGRDRDMDVMKENLEEMRNHLNLPVPGEILQALDARKKTYSVEITAKLESFIKNPGLKKLC